MCNSCKKYKTKFTKLIALTIVFYININCFYARHPAPVVNFEVSNLCFGDTTRFTNTSVRADYNYWTIFEKNGANYDTLYKSTNINIKFKFPHTGIFRVELDGDNGHFISIIRDFYIDNVLKANFDYQTCQSQFVNLSSCYSSCLWDFGDSTTSTQTSPIHYYKTIGKRIVKLTVFNTITSNTIIDTVQVYFTNKLTGNFFIKQTKDSVLFSAIDTIYGPFVQYHWAFGDGKVADLYKVSGGHNVYHSYLKKDTSYTVFLLVKTDCVSAFTQKNIFRPDSTPVYGTSIYPNPSIGDVLHIVTQRKTEITKVELYNYIGQLVNTVVISDKFKGIDLSLATLNLGVYFIRIYFGNDFIIKKIVKG